MPFHAAPDLNLLMRKSASFFLEFMFTRSMFATPDKARQGEILKQIATFVDAGKLLPTATATLGRYHSGKLRDAHARLESGRTLGKLCFCQASRHYLKGELFMTATALVRAFLGNIFSGKMDEALAIVDPQGVFVSTNPRPNSSNPLHGTFVGQDAPGISQRLWCSSGAGEFSVTAAFGDDEHAALYGTLRHKSRATGREFRQRLGSDLPSAGRPLGSLSFL